VSVQNAPVVPHKAHSRSACQTASWLSGHCCGAGCSCSVKEAFGAVVLGSVIIRDMELPGKGEKAATPNVI